MAKLINGTRVYGTATVDTQLIIRGTAASTSTLTGALLVAGGIGIRGDLWAGGTIYQNGYAVSTSTGGGGVGSPFSGIFTVTNVTQATATNTGALQIAGGAGIGGDLFVGGTLRTANIGTSTTDLNMLSTVNFSRSYTELVAQPTISAGAITLNAATAGTFDITLNANITTMTISNVAISGRTTNLLIILNYGATAYTVTWPASFRWVGGVAPVLTNVNGKRDIFSVFTTDGGTSFNAFIAGQNI